jgi:hypothetical protein
MGIQTYGIFLNGKRAFGFKISIGTGLWRALRKKKGEQGSSAVSQYN